ncbi:MAG: ABC transporter ATP-binding protein [Caldilineaceae bacterium]
MTNTPLLETRKLTKHFGKLIANDAIDLVAYAGEVHAILGENGAGKSTLMKSLYGYHRPTSGEILLNGKPTVIASPLEGRRLGIGMVFQNFTLIPAMSVIENIALFLPNLGIVMQPKTIEANIRQVSQRYGLEVDPRALVADLAMGERQRVEILKILLAGAKILIFDEPTSVLTPQETEGLFAIFRKLTGDGYAVLFITHKLPEVMATAQRITVLRQGAVAGVLSRSEASEDAIIRLMLGTTPPESAQRPVNQHSQGTASPVAELEEVSLVDKSSGIGLKAVTLSIFPGEIVGIAGVSGNGQSELGDVILGMRPIDQGKVRLMGVDVANWSIRQRLQSGVACIPEDPLRMGAIPGMSVAENMILGDQANYCRRDRLRMDWSRARSQGDRLLNTTFLSTPPGLDRMVETLSGGNLQRVVIARELGRQPRLLLAYYPARGLDISNAEAMRRLLLSYRAQGTAILLISEDMQELFTLSDRLAVLYHGRVVGLCRPEETDVYAVGRLMTGGK